MVDLPRLVQLGDRLGAQTLPLLRVDVHDARHRHPLGLALAFEFGPGLDDVLAGHVAAVVGLHDDPAELIRPLNVTRAHLATNHPDLAAQLDTLTRPPFRFSVPFLLGPRAVAAGPELAAVPERSG
ncbi:hypothetical protein ACIHCV_37935 [Streptomyces sp. NPDC051956]|uniref:hypothetical protein n=1 Tax=Streptomyces sp. NPDC051956 TaxID=3365677 RepID=UPI0037CDCA8D